MPEVTRSLFDQRRLNYDEAVRRLKYWAEQTDKGDVQANGKIVALATMLGLHRDNLYFEETANGN